MNNVTINCVLNNVSYVYNGKKILHDRKRSNT